MTRGVGKTAAMRKAIRDHGRPCIVIGASMQHAKQICDGLPNAIPMSAQDSSQRLKSNVYPVFTDHFAVEWLMDDREAWIEKSAKLRKQLQDLGIDPKV